MVMIKKVEVYEVLCCNLTKSREAALKGKVAECFHHL